MRQISFEFINTFLDQNDQLYFEKTLWERGLKHVAGIDEAGRGPLAGPVFAAAVIFPPDIQIDDIQDSKKLTARKREALFPVIQAKALAVGIGQADHAEIDQLNILQATFVAMNRALENLTICPDYVLVDGNQKLPNFPSQLTLVKGDSRSLSIGAASIIAKVSRDRVMLEYDARWPEYGFASHKGYGSKAHILAIKQNGYCPIHRHSFNVKQLADVKK